MLTTLAYVPSPSFGFASNVRGSSARLCFALDGFARLAALQGPPRLAPR